MAATDSTKLTAPADYDRIAFELALVLCRLDPTQHKKLIADHLEQAHIRGVIDGIDRADAIARRVVDEVRAAKEQTPC